MYKWLIYVICSSVSEDSSLKSTQVETRLPSSRQRRSLLPGPKASCPGRTTVRSNSLPSPTSPSSGFKHLLLGQEVTTSDGKIGVLRFKGKTHFTQGYLCGIELYDGNGKNDGSVDGIHYFECVASHGVFVPAYKCFPSVPVVNGQVQACKTVSSVKGNKKLHQSTTVTNKRLPRPKTLPFREGALQKDRRSQSVKSSGKGQINCYSGKVSTGTREKQSSASASKLGSRKVSPLNTSVTCPGWLGKHAPKSPNSHFSHHVSQKEQRLNDTFTIPGDDQSSLQRSYSSRRKHPKTSGEARNGYQIRHVMPDIESRGRLDSVPSYQNLSSIGGSDEEISTPTTRPDVVEDCHSRANRTYDMTKEKGDSYNSVGSPVTFEIGSQGSLGTWEENSVSCGKSNTSLAWDFDIPTASTPVEFHLRVGSDRKAQLSDDAEDVVSTDEEIEYNEFLAIPSFLDTPTGRCKFDLLTPEELEQALNESNLLPDELRDMQLEEEPILKFMDIENTPIWEPITPVEEEFLPFTAESTLDPNPLAFWSMDSVPLKSDIASDQEPVQSTEGGADMELTSSTAVTLNNGISSLDYHVSESMQNGHDVLAGPETNGADADLTAKLSPVDLLEGVNDDNLTLVLENETDKREGEPGVTPVVVELTIDKNSLRNECSDSSSCSNKTVMENLNGLEKVVDSVANDLKQTLNEITVNGQRNDKTSEKEADTTNLPNMKRKSLLIKPKTGTKTNVRTNVKTDTNVSKEKQSINRGGPRQKPPVPPKLSVIPRRKQQDAGKATAKLTEVKSRINTGRRSVDSNVSNSPSEKEILKSRTKEVNSKKEVTGTKRTNFHLRTEKDRVRKPSSSSVTSDNSRGRADSRGSVVSSRPSSKSDVSTDAKRLNRKITNPPPQNASSVSSVKKTTRANSLVSPGAKVTQAKEKLLKNNVTNVDAAPTRRPGFAVPAARKKSSSEEGVKNNKRQILAKDTKQAKMKKLKPQSGSNTPPDVVYTSVPDVRTNEEVKRLETLCNMQTKQLDTACKQIKVNAKAFEAMAVLVQYLTQECDAFCVPTLKKKINCLEIQINKTSDQIAAQEKEIARLREELSENKRRHKEELSAARESHEKEMEESNRKIEEQHKAEVDRLSKSHSEQLEREVDRYQKMKEEADSCRRDLEDQQLEHLDYVSNLQRKHEQDKLEDECRQEQAIAKLNGEAKLREQVLEDENLQLTYKCENLEEKIKMLEDALKKDSDAKVQAAVEQFKHLPEEVESLKTVLAMKNQENQEMRIKVMDLEKQVSKLPEKDDKIKRLEAKVEDLNAMMETKIVYERQLSSEQVTLRENFEKETNANKRLSMEKEELLWRLRTQNQSGQSSSSPGHLTPPKFNPSPIPSSPLTSGTLLSRASSLESHESGVFSPSNPQQ